MLPLYACTPYVPYSRIRPAEWVHAWSYEIIVGHLMGTCTGAIRKYAVRPPDTTHDSGIMLDYDISQTSYRT